MKAGEIIWLIVKLIREAVTQNNYYYYTYVYKGAFPKKQLPCKHYISSYMTSHTVTLH